MRSCAQGAPHCAAVNTASPSAGISSSALLATSSALLSAIGNDADFGSVFQRQLEVLSRPDDAVSTGLQHGAGERPECRAVVDDQRGPCHPTDDDIVSVFPLQC